MDITLDRFEGRWQLSRDIRDAKGPDARFLGSAEFTRCAKGLWMEERGELHMGGQAFAATRRYLWQPEGAAIAVYFEDGRFFHRFQPGAVEAAQHWCDPDDYAVRYDFTGWFSERPAWRTTWNVRGPRKAYRMDSQFRRIFDQVA